MSKIPNSPEDVKALREALNQVVEQISEIQSHKDQISQILDAAEDKFKIPKKTLRKVANIYHKQSVIQFEDETAEVKEVYSVISGVYKSAGS